MPKEAVLKLGYPKGVKVLLSVPLVACVAAVLRTLATAELGFSLSDVPVLFGAVFACLPAVYGFRTRCVADRGGITRHSVWGSQRFRRDDFLGHERIAAEPGKPADLLLRFKSGVIFLSAAQVDHPAQEVIDFLRAEWQVGASDYESPRLGAVDPVQCFEYENLHISMLLTIGILCTVVALQVHVVAMLALVAAFCFRAAWRAMGTLETSETGITYTHRFLGSVTLAWQDIESVSYWSSFAQGGARIRGRSGKKIRVYRWIARYPMLDRLMHDRLDAKVFWPTLTLPVRVDLNRRRRLGVIAPYMLLMMNVLELLWQGNLVTFAVVSAIPSFVAAALIWGSSRALEFDKDGVRDIWRYMWFEKVNTFRRTDLQEARLGRQLTVGGLWMRFGDTRLEIANTDVSLPPEQLLTCLREHWAWDQQDQTTADRLRGAA